METRIGRSPTLEHQKTFLEDAKRYKLEKDKSRANFF